jgi:hypothetical protein
MVRGRREGQRAGVASVAGDSFCAVHGAAGARQPLVAPLVGDSFAAPRLFPTGTAGSGRPSGAVTQAAAGAAARCCCGLIPRTRLKAVLSANGLP